MPRGDPRFGADRAGFCTTGGGLKVYAALSRLPFPRSYLGKLLLVAFVGTHVPLLALALYLLVARPPGDGGAAGAVLLVAFVATLLGAAATLWVLRALLAPFALASRALREYRQLGARPDLPTRFPDAAGRLMADVQHTVDGLDGVIASLEDLSTRDPLTRLPNRALFVDRLGQALGRNASGRGGAVAVAMVDLDGFGEVNDALGQEAGDRLLVEVAGRLGGRVRPGETLARLGGDEFAVLIEGSGGGAVGAAERVLEGLRGPFVVGGRETNVGWGAGFVAADAARDRPEDVLRKASLATRRAKEKGGGLEVFEEAMDRRLRERRTLREDLRRAASSLGTPAEEFEVLYQPVVLLRTGAVDGAEALLRWRRPSHGIVGPSDFVPIAEQTDLILPIGAWVIRRACRQAREWGERRPPGTVPGAPRINANLSVRQLGHPGLVGDVAGALREAGLEADALCLEVTESELVNGTGGAAARALRELKTLGVRIAVDDFGMGYSSLSYLRRLPVDLVKIDRSFVAGVGRDREAEALLSGMVSIAHALGLEVVAEGVETDAQAEALREMGCERAQGKRFSGPLPPEGISTLLAGPPRRS